MSDKEVDIGSGRTVSTSCQQSLKYDDPTKPSEIIEEVISE
jgi:hypothetical protein